jgi:4-amino-4-deoxy-L-arabinose transferase-like glycosyltransferase
VNQRLLKNPNLILSLIFLLALTFRLLGLTNIRLGGDFAEHWSVAGRIVKGNFFPLLGPSASINPKIHYGPFYYYLLSIPYLLGGGNYKVAIIFFSFINSLSIFPLFYISKKWLGLKSGLKLVTLYAFSSYIIQVQNFPWNPFLIPSLLIFSLYILLKIREKHANYLPLLLFLLGLGFSFHATFLFIIPLFLIFIPFKEVPGRVVIISLVAFFLALSPWFYYEIGNNFIQIKETLNVFSPSREVCNFSTWIKTHGNGERCFHQIRNTLFIFRLFSQSLFATRNLLFVMVSFLITFYTLIKTKNSQKIFFSVWIFTTFLFFLTYSRNVYLHFFLILIPLPFFILILFLERVERIKRYGIIISGLLFLTIIGWNLIDFINSLSSLR